MSVVWCKECAFFDGDGFPCWQADRGDPGVIYNQPGNGTARVYGVEYDTKGAMPMPGEGHHCPYRVARKTGMYLMVCFVAYSVRRGASYVTRQGGTLEECLNWYEENISQTIHDAFVLKLSIRRDAGFEFSHRKIAEYKHAGCDWERSERT